MFKIRNDQLDSLANPALQEYEEKAILYVKEEYPETWKVKGDVGVRDLVRKAVAKGKKYNLTRSNDITGLLSLMIVFGEDFETEKPERQQLLESPIDGAEKLQNLLDEMIRENESQA